MTPEIVTRGSGAVALIKLEEGESFRADSAALTAYTGTISITTDGPRPARRPALKRLLLSVARGNETFFTNTFTAGKGGGVVELSGWLTGEVLSHELAGGDALLVQARSFMAAGNLVHIDTGFQGFSRKTERGTPSFLRASGEGFVLMAAFGAVHTIDLDGELLVDAGHLLGLTQTLRYKPSGLAASGEMSGESLLLEVRGTGRMYLQTRNPGDYAETIAGRLKGAE